MGSRLVGKVILCILTTLGWVYYSAPAVLQDCCVMGLSWLLFRLQIRKKVVEQNLLYAYPTEPARREYLLKESYRHLARLAIEIIMVLGPLPRFIRKHCQVKGVEHWENAKKKGCGVIFLTGHIGNWEIMAAAGALLNGMDILMVTKHLKPEWLHQAIEKGRLRCEVRGTYEPRTMRDILQQLKHNGTLGMVLDQYAGPPVGVRVPFFGIPVSTTTALAALVKRTGAVVLPVVNYRDAEGRFNIEIGAPIPWQEHSDAHRELACNTACFSSRVEGMVRDHPDQWLWIHRRFKGDLSPLREDEWQKPRARS